MLTRHLITHVEVRFIAVHSSCQAKSRTLASIRGHTLQSRARTTCTIDWRFQKSLKLCMAGLCHFGFRSQKLAFELVKADGHKMRRDNGALRSVKTQIWKSLVWRSSIFQQHKNCLFAEFYSTAAAVPGQQQLDAAEMHATQRSPLKMHSNLHRNYFQSFSTILLQSNIMRVVPRSKIYHGPY